MKRNFELLVIISMLVFTIAACGTNDYNSDYEEDYEEYEDYEGDYDDEDYNEDEPEETVIATYPFTKLQPFSEGRAWINFDKDGVPCTGIIDTDGILLYQAEGNFSYMSQFADGLAFYRETIGSDSICGIVDLEGNILFESQITADGGYLLLAYGNGQFLVAQHIQNFDTDEWEYGTIDKNGNILNKMKKEDISADKLIDKEIECRYIGENFIILPRGIYNISTGYFSVAPISDNFTTASFYKGRTILGLEEALGLVERTFVIDTNFRYNRYGENGDTEAEGIVKEIDSDHIGSLYSDGLIWYNDTEAIGYCNIDEEIVISLEKYREKNVVGGAFHEGYAIIAMTGADGGNYICAIDRKGNINYDPIKIDDHKYGLNNSVKGFFQATIDGEEKIIDSNGKIYTVGVDDLSVCEDLTFGDISEGFIIMGGDEDNSESEESYYVSLDNTKFIDSAKLTSEHVDNDFYEEEISDDSAEDDTDSYIVPDSYDITGKWKNVGDKGFGQAQPGAIVIFDGSRCNFYSPNDSYAFYQDGNKYILDVTSPLAESLSFTVNIIDENNINISGTNLERVE